MFVPVTGAAYANSNALIGNGSNGIDDVLLSAGWERSTRGQQISGTAGAVDRVYWSAGESGRESLYLRVTQTTTDNIDFRGNVFWDPVGSAGVHGIGNNTGNSRLTGQSSGAFVSWMYATKDYLTLAMRIGGQYRLGYMGNLVRQIAPQQSGRTVIANGGLGAASGQPFVKVADVTNLIANQFIWICNQKAGANNGNLERQQILSINPTTSIITLAANLASNYDDGALVAQDPQPLLLWTPLTGASNAWIGSGNVNQYMFNTAIAFSAAPGAQLPFIPPVTADLNPGLTSYNPDVHGQVGVEQFLFNDPTVGRQQTRGYQPRICRVPTVPGMTDEGIVTVGVDTYILFSQADGTFVAMKQTV